MKQKKSFQDVLPPRHSIRDINISSRRQPVAEKPTHLDTEEEKPKTRGRIPINKSTIETVIDNSESSPISSQTHSYAYTYDDSDTRKPSRKIFYIASVFFVLALAFGISVFFKSAEVRVTPRSQATPLAGTFTAYKDAVDSTLGFQLVTVTQEAQVTVPATGEQNVNRKARGTIVVYNNATTEAQKLIATTRFQASTGQVYRIVSSVSIPGKQTKAGKVIPGSVEAVVEADQSGDTYNIGLADFTLPAFKSDPKFTTIYARSKTAMSGGFVGVQKGVSAEDLAKANASLEQQLRNTFGTDISSQIPENFVMFNESVRYTFSEPTQAKAEGDGALLVKKGTATALIFDKTALSRQIVKQVLSGSDEPIKVDDLEKLVFAFSSTGFDSATASQVSFTLSGDAHLVWTFDENKFKTDILGLTRDQAKTLGGTYPAIKEITVETKPFWNMTIPMNVEKVTVTNSLSK